MPVYGNITAALTATVTAKMRLLSYRLPCDANAPASLCSVSDAPMAMSSLAYTEAADASGVSTIDGMQAFALTPSTFYTVNYGQPVTSANAFIGFPTVLARWGNLVALETVTQAATGSTHKLSAWSHALPGFPSSAGPQTLPKIDDPFVIAGSIFSGQNNMEPVRWMGKNYMLMQMFSADQANGLVVLGDETGALTTATIWPGPDTTQCLREPNVFPDTGDGWNYFLQDGQHAGATHPSIVKVSSGSASDAHYNFVTLDNATYDAAFRAAASGVVNLGPNGFSFLTPAGYVIELSKDGATYRIINPVPADQAASDAMGSLTNMNIFNTGWFRSTDGQCWMTRPLVSPNAVLWSGGLTPNIGTLHRWRGQVGINWRGLALVGDAFTNVVGLSDFNSFTEYGNTMRFLITTPPLHEDRKRIFIPRIEIEVEAAGGLPSNPSEPPLMVLRWSKDGGKTWSSLAPTASMGVVGQFINRLRWINLGSSRTWTFELTCTDPVRRYVIGTYADSYKGYG